MITDSIQSCISAIKQKQDALRSKQSFEEYQKILALLSVECQNLERSLDTIDSIAKNKISDLPLLDNGTKIELLEAIDDCGIALENGQLGKEGFQVFGSRTKQLQRDLTTTWKECATRYADSVTGYLGIVQGLTDSPKEVADLRDQIIKLASSDPTATDTKRLAADVARANGIISQFSLKPEIEVFLKKVSSKTATVKDVTPEVLSWLESQKLVNKLRVSF